MKTYFPTADSPLLDVTSTIANFNSLREESEIIKSWKGPIFNPLVSICCGTFNQEEFIENAISSFLNQITNFPFEIIVRDDASTDETSNILRRYSIRYPNILKIIIEPVNTLSAGISQFQVWPQISKGKYIALCDGDDFWINPNKLQDQVQMFIKHKNLALCTGITLFGQWSNNKFYIEGNVGNITKDALTFEENLQYYYHTSTFLIPRNIFSEIESSFFKGSTLFDDRFLRLALSTIGEVRTVNNIVSAYRKNSFGIWTGKSTEDNLIATLSRLNEFRKNLDFSYRSIIDLEITRLNLMRSKSIFSKPTPHFSKLLFRSNLKIIKKNSLNSKKFINNERIIIFGAGSGGFDFLNIIENTCKVIAIADNKTSLHTKILNGIIIINPAEIDNYKYDLIVIASDYYYEIYIQLVETMNIQSDKVRIFYQWPDFELYKRKKAII